jgi:cyclic pyranopterin phosphate synthase
MPLIDHCGRKIDYLRLSVTDRCNMRCCYCMPETGVAKIMHAEILSYEQLYQLAQATVALGIEKIRVTGGEPLVRKGIIAFLARLSGIPGLKQLVLTTNGQLLPEMAPALLRAGVQRLNISLDSLHPEVFARVTRCGDLERVLAGIAAAEKIGMPLKLNMVVMRGINDNELLDFAALTLQRRHSVRFIEYMPVIQGENWQSLVVPGAEILARIAERYSFTPVVKGALSGPAREYKIDGALGTLGIITALSGHFCADCNRIRITAAGRVKTCLFADDEVDLRPLLATADAAVIQTALRRLVGEKQETHGLNVYEAGHKAFTMAQVGG